MHRWKSLLLVGVVAPIVAIAGESAESIVQKHFEAMGGPKYLTATSLQFKSVTTDKEKQTQAVIQRERPNRFRAELTANGKTSVKAYDGQRSWYQEGDAPAKVADAELSKKMASKAEFDDALVDYAKKGHKLELTGTAAVNGSPAYVLKLTRATGEVETRYLNTRSFLEVKRVVSGVYDGKPYEKAMTFGDYRKVDGVMINHLVEWGEGDAKGRQVISDVKFNADIPDTVFQAPAPRS